MRATEPEFRYRFWIIGAIFGLGFGRYRVDHANLGGRLSGVVFIVGGLLLFLLRLIGREEGELGASRGEVFHRYRDRVPRLLPSLRPRLPPSGARPRWGRAALAEVFIWAFAVGAALFAATLDFQLVWPVWLAGLAVRLTRTWWRRLQPA